jgi:hypothetical protein
MIPMAMRRELVETLFREDIEIVLIRTFLDVFEMVYNFLLKGFVGNSSGLGFEYENVFIKFVDLRYKVI